jgi:hypothetical protein
MGTRPAGSPFEERHGLDHFKAYVWSSVVAYNFALFVRLRPPHSLREHAAPSLRPGFSECVSRAPRFAAHESLPKLALGSQLKRRVLAEELVH